MAVMKDPTWAAKTAEYWAAPMAARWVAWTADLTADSKAALSAPKKVEKLVDRTAALSEWSSVACLAVKMAA